MKFDSSWLIDLLDGEPDADLLSDQLTDCGFLVELREPGEGAEIWDVEVTTNRPDAMNHRGLAREAAVTSGLGLRPLSIELTEGGEKTSDLATIEIADPSLCTRFAARVVRGVHQVPSPDWLQRRLVNCGVRPINAVVDVTNYVLLELGQPLHAYDLDRVHDRTLVARRAVRGEKLKTLDGEDRILDETMAVIADGEGVVGLAGIMGGASSEISDGTVDVLLEAAHFDALSVRRTARRLGMHTEASHRFERGADPSMPPVAVDLAAAMMADLAGGVVCQGRIDVRPVPHEGRRMELSVKGLSAFAGLEIAPERVVEIFAGLDFEPVRSGDIVTVTVPSFRVDIERMPDLYEEIIRHIGYGAVPSALPVLPTTPGRRNPNWELVDRARSAAVSVGLAEVMNWSFIDAEADELVAEQPLCPGEAVVLDNPLATTQAVMRRSLLPGLLSAARLNLNQGESTLGFFEQGRVFSTSDGAPRESERLGIVVLGDSSLDAVEQFRRFKGVVEQVCRKAGLAAVGWVPGAGPWLEEGAGALLRATGGEAIGIAGMLASSMASRWDLGAGVAVAEIVLDASVEPPLPRFEALPRYPAVVMDMTVEHDEDVSYAVLEESVRGLAGDRVESVSYVTRFLLRDGSCRVRTTQRLVYRDPERSLTQDEVNAEHMKLREGLAERLGVSFA
jgi:phenylalanyl-tRNA synthetase beta chain